MNPRSLVADDVRDNRLLATQWLEELCHETTEACNGVEAWQIVQIQHFDLIVTDIEMPGLSGLELLQHLRGHAADCVSHVPVIVMSSLQDGSLEETAYGFGATVVVRKPLAKDDFQRAVKTALAMDANQNHPGSVDASDPPGGDGPGPISPTFRRLVDRARRRP